MPGDNQQNENQQFSIVLGGPLFRIFKRARLSDVELELVKRRIFFISLFCWLPLLVLSVLDGRLLGGNISVPFLLDVDVHIRFLLVVPLLILAELVVHRRMKNLVNQFEERNLIPENGKKQFDRAISSSIKLRNSYLPEVLIIAFIYVVGVFIIWPHFVSLKTDTWYLAANAEGPKLSLAGVWLGYVSLPIFQFLLLRWYYRLFIWMRFLWKVSRIKLNLMPMHPDRLGGLGFISGTVIAFIPLVIAHGALLAGQISNYIFYLGASLLDFKLEIGIIVLFLLCVILVPLMVFSPQLANVKRKGKREYGTLAQRYVRDFDSKWLHEKAPVDEPLIGSADIQSLADLGNSYEIVKSMHIVPVTKDNVFQIVAATLLPIIPLALTLMPLEELLKKLLGILF